EVGAVEPLDALGDDRPAPAQPRARGGTATGGTGTEFHTGEEDEGNVPRGISLSSVVDRLYHPGEEVLRVAALDAVQELVAQADVREGAANHDLVVPAARSVGVEVAPGDPVLAQVLPRR